MADAPAPPRPLDRLIGDLSSADPLARDTAVARLRVLGGRALPRLIALVATGPHGPGGAAALAALEGSDDPRAAGAARTALDSRDVDVVIAALGVLRAWVTREPGTELLEAITAIAVDRGRDAHVRLAALDALADLPADLLAPIRAQAPPPETAGPALDTPAAAHAWVDAHGARASLARLHDAVQGFREREMAARGEVERDAWQQARGAAHRALAARGSRLALYDARETVAAAPRRLPPGFVETVRTLGDAACLAPLARAWAAAGDPGWRAELADAARSIVRRARLGARNPVLKGVRRDWPGFV